MLTETFGAHLDTGCRHDSRVGVAPIIFWREASCDTHPVRGETKDFVTTDRMGVATRLPPKYATCGKKTYFRVGEVSSVFATQGVTRFHSIGSTTMLAITP
eukprot:scaffold1342_cov115-Skeletonema_dohrnii-CCMP3373.AAC.5